jgi:hypothetical protein
MIDDRPLGEGGGCVFAGGVCLLAHNLVQACSAFYSARATSAKFGLLTGNIKFSAQNEK